MLVAVQPLRVAIVKMYVAPRRKICLWYVCRWIVFLGCCLLMTRLEARLWLLARRLWGAAVFAPSSNPIVFLHMAITIRRTATSISSPWSTVKARIMSNTFDIQPIGRFVGQSAAIKRPRVCLHLPLCYYIVFLFFLRFKRLKSSFFFILNFNTLEMQDACVLRLRTVTSVTFQCGIEQIYSNFSRHLNSLREC